MGAIFRRELNSYFSSPIAYIYLAVFYFFSAVFFTFSALETATATMSVTFSQMFNIVLYLLPILTMKSFSEDKRNKTDQILITSPVTVTDIVIGKFLSVFFIYCVACASFVLYAGLLNVYVAIEWGVFFCNLIGIVLMGASIIAIGCFISILTESQIIAAVASFFVSLALSFVDQIALAMPTQNFQNMEFYEKFKAVPVQILKSVFSYLGYYPRYTSFTTGILNISDVIFFLTITSLFLFLTARCINKKRFAN